VETTTLPGAALTLIHTGAAPTRSALTAKLGVTRATTGAIAGELRDLRLIQVEAAAPADGHLGRPSHRLLPDPDGPVALAAEIHTDGFAVALIGLGAVTVARVSRDRPVPSDPARALAPVSAAAADLLRASGRTCVGVALAVSFAVTEPGGAAVGALYFGWPDGVQVGDIFAAQLARHGVTGPNGEPLACRAVNDINALALAEHRHGAGRDAAHLLVVAATRRGVGSALVLRGGLYTGSTGLAMEAGHVSIDPHGRPCPCGSRGCLNVETDAGRFLEEAGQSPDLGPARPDAAGRSPDPGGASPDDAGWSHQQGAASLDAAIALLGAGYPADPAVRAAASTVIARLGLGLAGLVNVVNPDRVLLGGLHKHLLLAAPDELRDAVAARSPWDRGAAVPIAPCALDDAILIGAAELAWQPVLDNPAILRSPA
jgi:predicted NBD/HSP70 family sugar kinase